MNYITPTAHFNVCLQLCFAYIIISKNISKILNHSKKLQTKGEIPMSMFGDYLRNLIDTNKVNIYNIAKQAGLERTAIHKIINNNRIPSDEYVQKLANVLELTPEEHQRLIECFKISKIGEHKYKQRIQIKNLIESIAYIENGASGNNDKNSPPTHPPTHPCFA